MIDLHIHTKLSDGTDSVEELLEKIKEKNIKIFSFTDHDNIEACKIIQSKYKNFLIDNNIKFINGIEFSTDFKGKSRHILAYNFDIKNEIINKLIKEGKERRNSRTNKRLELLKKDFNINFSKEELDNLKSYNNLGKPQIANILIQKGYASSIEEAISKYLYHKFPADKLSAEYVIKNIKLAGGISVLAHGLGGEGEKNINPQEFAEDVKTLKSFGLKGLECYYSKYSYNEREIIKAEAIKYNLLLSGGSDYHGKNKTILLGNVGKDYTAKLKDFRILNDIG